LKINTFYKTILVCFVNVLIAVSANAQKYQFLQYTIGDGLVHSQVYAACQDDKGYIWFATTGGLSRFDGQTFVNYTKDDGLLNNKIKSLHKDNQGNIWIGSQGGLTMFNGSTFKTFPFPKKQKDLGNEIFSICQAKDSSLWLATNKSGVANFKQGKYTFLSTKDGLNHFFIRSVTCDDEGVIWIGSRKGINTYKNGKLSIFRINGKINVNVSDIKVGRKGEIFISTINQGFYSYFRGNTKKEKNFPSINVRSIHIDANQTIWLASKTGVIKLDNNYQFWDEKIGMPSKDITQVFSDNEDNIWMCTRGQGVLRLTNEALTSYDQLGLNEVMSITQDKHRNLWFGTYSQGIVKYDGKKYHKISTKDGLTNNTVWSLYVDRNDVVWAATTEGVSVYDGDIFQSFSSMNGLLDDKITAIYKDGDKMIFGSKSGLTILGRDGFKSYPIGKKLTGRNIRTIEKKQGKYWLGVNGGILSFSLKEGYQQYQVSDASDNIVYAIKKDKKGNLWIGSTNGLYYRKGSDFIRINYDKRSSSNNINFLLFDRHEMLWLGSDNGVFEVDVNNYLETGLVSVLHYSDRVGLKSLETNLGSAFEDRSGFLWFGTNGGLMRYNRSKDTKRNKEFTPELSLSSVKLFMQEVDWDKYSDSIDVTSGLPVGLIVPYTENHLSFFFNGISHYNPEKVNYQFKLDGFDEEWYVPEQNFMTYPNLPFGKFTFLVKSKVGDGKWVESKPFSFVISPPFWKAKWFLLICIFLAFLIGYAIYRWRTDVNNRKQQTQQLEYKSKLMGLELQSLNASMNRHFIFNALNSIQYYINRKDRISANRYLSSFAKLIRKNLDSTTAKNNMVSLAEEIERLELYLGLENMRFQDKFEYQLTINPSIDIEIYNVPSMLLQPFIENAIWHGVLPSKKKGKILIDIDKQEDQSIVFSIQDNGIGVDVSRENKSTSGQVHESKGIMITNGRISLLQKITNENIFINGPFELKGNDGITIGTKVEIILTKKSLDLLE